MLGSDASALEKSNLLMKAREVLTHSSDGSTAITVPWGISIYPFNVRFVQFGTFTFLLAIVGVVMIAQVIERKKGWV